MNCYRNTARIVGALFIITMIGGMVNAYLVDSLLFASLADVFPKRMNILIGSLLMLIMSTGIVGIAILLFPILNQYNNAIAVTYVSFRSMECVFLLVGVIVSLVFIPLSEEYIKAGAPGQSHFQAIAMVALKVRDSAYQIAMLILGIGSLMFCYLLFQTKLVPRFISVVGLIGYTSLSRIRLCPETSGCYPIG